MFVRLVLAGCIAALTASAGTMLTETETDLSSSQRVAQTIVQLDNQKVRVDRQSADENVAFIFRGDLDEFLVIDKLTRKVRRMRREDLERASEQIGASMSQLEKQLKEQLKSMPEEQRTMVEQMMKARMGAAQAAVAQPSEPTTYTKVRSGASVGKWTADQYAGQQGGAKRWDVYTVPASSMRLSPADLAPLQEMSEFFTMMAQKLGAGHINSDELFQVRDAPEAGEFAGVPVRRVQYEDGQAVAQYDLTDVAQIEFEEALFEVPAGFEEESITFGLPQ